MKAAGKLIIEHTLDGVFFYYESESHHATTEPQRKSNGLERLDWDELEEECEVRPGQYMVVPIVGKTPRSRSVSPSG